ncbi:MAG: helix-turn-helix transcriptional regulator [Chloroflexi bacterium]|nr:helix-turn-helix transcriptional regulator [Chloroflexota bacterium]
MSGNAVRLDDVIAERCASDPEFREYWERMALARAMAIAVIRYRSEHELSQRALARQLGMPYSQIARLELGEHNPSIETLQRLAKGLGRRFIVAVAPDQATEISLPKGVEILSDVVLEDGSRVLAAAG